jgi:hypothetical protein
MEGCGATVKAPNSTGRAHACYHGPQMTKKQRPSKPIDPGVWVVMPGTHVGGLLNVAPLTEAEKGPTVITSVDRERGIVTVRGVRK